MNVNEYEICADCMTKAIWVKMGFTQPERAAIIYALTRLAHEIQINPAPGGETKPGPIYSAMRKIMLTASPKSSKLLADFYRQDLGIETMPESCTKAHDQKRGG